MFVSVSFFPRRRAPFPESRFDLKSSKSSIEKSSWCARVSSNLTGRTHHPTDNHLLRSSKCEGSCLQLRLGAGGGGPGAGGSDGGSRGGAGRSAGGDLAGSLGGGSRSVLAGLAGRARGAGGGGGGNGGERRSAGRSSDEAGASLDGGRAERRLGLGGSEAELVQGVVVVVTEARVGVVGGLGEIVAGRRGGSTVCAGSLVLSVGACEAGRVLAGKSSELVALATLGNGDAVLVEPLLDLAVRPAVEELVGKALLGVLGLVGGGVVLAVGFLSSNVRVTTDGGNEGVAVAGLRDGDTALIEPGLQVRVRPLRVEPVAGVSGGLAGLVCRGLVVGADGGEERVASAGLGVGNAVVVKESLELRVGPTSGC